MQPDQPLHRMSEDELADWIEELRQSMRIRWVQVADAVLAGSSGRQAYWNAYYATEHGPEVLPEYAEACDNNGSRLMGSDRVKAYMDACRHQMARSENVTVSLIVRRQLDIAQRAKAAGDLAAERQSMAEVAKLLDLYPTERKELLLSGSGLADLDDAEWAALIESSQEATHATQH